MSIVILGIEFGTNSCSLAGLGECGKGVLNREIVHLLRKAQTIIEGWSKPYNARLPHSALAYRPPASETIVQMGTRPTMN